MRFYTAQQFYMLTHVSTYLKKKQDLYTAKVPVLKTFIEEYQEMFQKVHAKEIGVLKKTQIETSKKTDAKGLLIDSVLKLVQVLKILKFRQSGNTSGQTLIFSRSDLNRATAENLPKICNRVIIAAKKIKNLGIYGLSQEDIADARAYLKEFSSRKNKPKLKKKEIAKSGTEVSVGIRKCILFLENSIDPLIEIAAKDNYELHMGYFSRRIILPKGQGRMSDREAAYRKNRKRKPKGGSEK